MRAVCDTEVGRLGMLICGENSSYPPVWPTRPSRDNGGYNLRRAIEIRAGSHAFEAKVFNIVASGALDVSMRDALAQMDADALATLEGSPRGVSMILDPTGSIISETASSTEGIVYADIDVSACVEPKQFHDVVGYYNRFDVFQLRVDRTPREPADFSQELSVPAENHLAADVSFVEAPVALRS